MREQLGLSKSVLVLLVSVILVITGQGMAFARGQAPADSRMVLCTGHGAVMVYMDAQGRPTSPPQLCADGAQAVFAELVCAPLLPMWWADVVSVALRFEAEPLLVGRFERHVRVRGPPAVVI